MNFFAKKKKMAPVVLFADPVTARAMGAIMLRKKKVPNRARWFRKKEAK